MRNTRRERSAKGKEKKNQIEKQAKPKTRERDGFN
jgi:hypothetical protein